jgi:hypothetical protein
MYIKNRTLAIGFRVLLVGVCLYGIILNTTAWGSDWIGILSYYTLQSNIVVLGFFGFLLVRNLWTRKAVSPTIKGGVTVCITLTFLVYHFVLRPMMFSMEATTMYNDSLANVLVHYVVPLMVIADWLMFDKKGMMKKLDPLRWTAIPWAYFIFALIRAQFGDFSGTNSRYPYFFIDIDKYGVGQVALNILFFAIGYVTLGYVIYFVDFGMGKLGGGNRGRAGAKK